MPKTDKMESSHDIGFIGVLTTIVAIVIVILMIIAVLSIPKIVKYQKGTFKLTALMAKKTGVPVDEIKSILTSTDGEIRTEFNDQLDKFLDYGD